MIISYYDYTCNNNGKFIVNDNHQFTPYATKIHPDEIKLYSIVLL